MKKITTVDVSQPVHGYICYMGRFWFCKDGDPTKAIFVSGSAQCNTNSAIMTDKIRESLEKETGWSIGVVFLPVAYRPPMISYEF